MGFACAQLLVQSMNLLTTCDNGQKDEEMGLWDLYRAEFGLGAAVMKANPILAVMTGSLSSQFFRYSSS